MRLKRWLSELIYGPPRLLQRCLLERALLEEGISPRRCRIDVDHNFGKSKVNGVNLGLIYPRSYLRKVRRLTPNQKTFHYYFNGAMPASGGRRELMEPFFAIQGTKIVESRVGRLNRFKGRFNKGYYRDMARARFVLCPHQINWKGSREALWTYRFAEACIAGAVPVVFRRTPLCEEFVWKFNHVWDDEVPHYYDKTAAQENQSLAEARFFLQDADREGIMRQQW